MKPKLSDADRTEIEICLRHLNETAKAYEAAEAKVEELSKVMTLAPQALAKEFAGFDSGDDEAKKRISDLKLQIETAPHRIPVAEQAQKAAATSLSQACNSAQRLVEKITGPRLTRLELLIGEYLGRVWFNGWASPQIRQTDLFRTAVHFKTCHWNNSANNIHSRASGAAQALQTLLDEQDIWLNLEDTEA